MSHQFFITERFCVDPSQLHPSVRHTPKSSPCPILVVMETVLYMPLNCCMIDRRCSLRFWMLLCSSLSRSCSWTTSSLEKDKYMGSWHMTVACSTGQKHYRYINGVAHTVCHILNILNVISHYILGNSDRMTISCSSLLVVSSTSRESAVIG